MNIKIDEMMNFVNNQNFSDVDLDTFYNNYINGNLWDITNVPQNCEKDIKMLFVLFTCTVFERKIEKEIKFVSVKDFKNKNNIQKFSEFIKLMFFCEEEIPKISDIIKEDLYYNIYYYIARYYFIMNNFIEALDYIKMIEIYNFKESINQDHLVLKALILEELAIYNYITPYKNITEIKNLIQRINENNCPSTKSILEELKKEFDKNIFPLSFSEIQNNKIPEEIIKENRAEKIFYINNRQILNPYNRLLIGSTCPLEGVDDKILDIKNNVDKDLFESLLKDFYYVRELNYKYQQNEKYDIEDFCIVDIFAYSLFDKISWIIKSVLKLKLNDDQTYFLSIFNNENIFDANFENSKPLFALYTYQRLLNKKQFSGQKVIIPFTTLRNDIYHKTSSKAYVDDMSRTVHNNLLIQTLSGAIIQLNMLIYLKELDTSKDWKSTHLFIIRNYINNKNKDYLQFENLCSKNQILKDEMMIYKKLYKNIKDNFINKIKENYDVKGLEDIKIENTPVINLFITINKIKINFQCITAKWKMIDTPNISIEQNFKEELINFCDDVNKENFKI